MPTEQEMAEAKEWAERQTNEEEQLIEWANALRLPESVGRGLLERLQKLSDVRTEMLAWVEVMEGGFDPLTTLYQEIKGNRRILVEADLPRTVLEDFVRKVVCVLVVLAAGWEEGMIEGVD